MKKNILLLSIAVFITAYIQAQYVTVPDPTFFAYLQQKAPGCTSGNQLLDTTCSQSALFTSMDCSSLGISDLTGIQYFAHLDTLICYQNTIDTIYALPPNLIYLDADNSYVSYLATAPASLQYLDCDNNYLYSLPNLSNTALTYLDCSANDLSALSPLPSSLQSLYCYQNNIALLPISLPSPLTSLDCDQNVLTALPPILPSGLTYFNCEGNQITSLPTLPSGLMTLDCSYNQLTSLPGPLPPLNGQGLYCDNNMITVLPTLPAQLPWLNCGNNQLTALPAIPSTVTYLDCDHNQIATIPALPSVLNQFFCQNNPVSTSPALPTGLQQLLIDSTLISVMPTLPASLTYLSCPGTPMAVIPALPTGLLDLACGSTQLTTIAPLPASLTYFSCQNTLLTSLPAIPSGTIDLFFNYDPALTSLPVLPGTINYLSLYGDSSLYCLPALDTVNFINLFATGITCLPSIANIAETDPPIGNYPLCNGTGCTAYWNISGQTYFDANNDCVFNGGDVPQQNVKLQLYQNGVLQQQVYTNYGGLYSMDASGLGAYQVVADTSTLPFTVLCPTGDVYNDTLIATDSLQPGNNFALTCKSGFDLAVWSIADAGALRADRPAGITIGAGDLANFYGASCAGGVAGTVTLTISGPAAYTSLVSGALNPTTADSNSVTWSIADFGTVNAFTGFNIVITPTIYAHEGDAVCITVSVSPTAGDNNPANNTLTQCFTIVSSFDPNDKEVYPANNVDTNGWLTYTIHFQNTGNDTAFNVSILDTLNSYLDISSIQLLAASQLTLAQILPGNIAKFTFANINLPDSAVNPTGSIGYIQYKIKVNSNEPEGTPIWNTASIYFDLNQPVQTNTTLNTIGLPTGITTLQNDAQALIYPNPSVGNWQLTVDNSLVGSALQVFDDEGRLILKSQITNNKSQITAGDLPSGVYYLRISNDKVSVVKKLVKL